MIYLEIEEQMVCKGICVLYETKALSGSKIDSGIFKKCSVCSIKIKSEKLYCPCCGRRLSLRTKRGSYPKSVIKKRQNIEIII